MSSASVSPTAHYTGHIWARNGLSHPALDTTIVGTSRVDHLRSNLAFAAKGPLPDDLMAEVKARLTAVGAKPA